MDWVRRILAKIFAKWRRIVLSLMPITLLASAFVFWPARDFLGEWIARAFQQATYSFSTGVLAAGVSLVDWFWRNLSEWRRGFHMKQLWRAAGFAGFAWVLIFLYHFCWSVPREIRRTSGETRIAIPRAPAPPIIAFSDSRAGISHRKAEHSAVIHLRLIFRESPLFTASRKERISNSLDVFYKYLTGLGFDFPTKIPPLGTRQGRTPVATFSGGPSDDPTFTHSITIGAQSINDLAVIRKMYASYWFRWLLESDIQAPPPNSNVNFDRIWTSEILAIYYVHSASGVPPKQSSGFNGWVDALWQLRQEFTPQFVDRALFYATKAPELTAAPYDPQMREFNKYFSHRLMMGMDVIDNQLEHVGRTNEVLRSRGLLP